MKKNKKDKVIEAVDKIISNLKHFKIKDTTPIEQPLCDIYMTNYNNCNYCILSGGTFRGCMDNETYFKVPNVMRKYIYPFVSNRLSYFKEVRKQLDDIPSPYFSKSAKHIFSNTIQQIKINTND